LGGWWINDFNIDMIVDLFLYLVANFLDVLAHAFGLLNYLVPTQVSSSVEYLIGQSAYLAPIFPVETVILVAEMVLTVLIFKYILAISVWIFKFIPFNFGNPNPPTAHGINKGSVKGTRFKFRIRKY
jgi:hypothetical protein